MPLTVWPSSFYCMARWAGISAVGEDILSVSSRNIVEVYLDHRWFAKFYKLMKSNNSKSRLFWTRL